MMVKIRRCKRRCSQLIMAETDVHKTPLLELHGHPGSVMTFKCRYSSCEGCPGSTRYRLTGVGDGDDHHRTDLYGIGSILQSINSPRCNLRQNILLGSGLDNGYLKNRAQLTAMSPTSFVPAPQDPHHINRGSKIIRLITQGRSA